VHKKILAWLLCLALLSAPGGTCFADGCYDSCTCENCCAVVPVERHVEYNSMDG